MSLINQVLQDLDQRRATAPAVPAGAHGVRAPSRRGASRRWAGLFSAALGGAVIACVGALAWSTVQSSSGPAQAATGSGSQPIARPAISAAGVTTASPVTPGPDTAMPGLATASTSAPAEAQNLIPALAPGTPVTATEVAPAHNVAPVRSELPSASKAPNVRSDSAVSAAAAEAVTTGSPRVTSAMSARAADDEPRSSAGALADARLALAPTSAPAPRVRPAPPALAAEAANAVPMAAVEARVEKRVQMPSARERAEAAYQRGIASHQQGRDEDAEAAFMSALQEERGHTAARLALAISLAGRGAFLEAQNLLVEGLEHQPRQLSIATTLARLKQNRDLPGAIAVLKSALASGAGPATPGEHAQALAVLATLQQNSLQHAQAIENYAAALRLAPGNGAWWIGLGLSLGADGRPHSAREAYARARSTDSLGPELQQFVDQRLR